MDGETETQEAALEVGEDRATYQFTVVTSDILNAGTDADVTVQLFGQKGKQTEKMSLCPDKRTSEQK